VSPAKSASKGVQRGLSVYAPEVLTWGDQVEVQVANVAVADVDVPSKILERELDQDNVRNLADSIRAEGRLLQPIIVHRRGPKFELVAGRHRLEAFHALGLQEIPAQVWDLEDLDRASARIAENLVRRRLPPFEEAQALQELRDLGLTLDQVADRTGVSVGTVKNRLKLLKLPLEVAQLVDGDQVTLQDAQLVAGLKDDPQALEVGVRVLKEGNVTKWRLSNALEEAKVGVNSDGWKIGEKVGYDNKAFQKAVGALPHVKVGSGKDASIIVTDKKALQELVSKHSKQKKTTGSAAPARPLTERRAALERQFTEELQLEAAARSIRGMVASGAQREMGELVQHMLWFRVERNADWKWLAKATELDEKVLWKIVSNQRGAGVEELGKLAKRDELAVWKIIAGVIVLRNLNRFAHSTEQGLSEDLCKAYTGRTPAQWRALARAKAKAELAKKAAKKSPTKKQEVKKSKKPQGKRGRKRAVKKRAAKKRGRSK
jgi:ParB family transcriptional regulator, chromosome partitioning protein